jgi:D-sedoheptulose 7-phosphate isomerase
MTLTGADLRTFVAERLLARNPVSRLFFDREADRLARACEEMAQRFLAGGRLLAFGAGTGATDAQHVSVEFVHPVIVGKRALPALDVSAAFSSWIPVLARDRDIVMGFGARGEDAAIAAALGAAARNGAWTFALPGASSDYGLDSPSPDRSFRRN